MKAFLLAISLLAMGCAKTQELQMSDLILGANEALYSKGAQEMEVQYEALYRTSYTSLAEIAGAASSLQSYEIPGVTRFLFGPLTHRYLGAPQKGEKIQVHLDRAQVINGRVVVPYTYRGLWLVASPLLEIPVPYNERDLETPGWKQCTDSDPEHQTVSFYWYFWDPTRSGCQHKEGREYQIVSVKKGAVTKQTTLSTPEYKNMIRTINGRKVLAMTFAFGYVEDKGQPNIFSDMDAGMAEFRSFASLIKKELVAAQFRQESVTQADYGRNSNVPVGVRFVGAKNGVEIRVTVVAAAGVDQMELFAKSFAQDHEGFFGWFGHSRVGSGFDADKFLSIVRSAPGTYSVRPDYQLIYWAGCNSYSYYTLPFFNMKPNGTRGLDIISNGLPSLFSFNDSNALILYRALYSWEKNTSYQALIDAIEGHARRNGEKVLANVLGDEDNKP